MIEYGSRARGLPAPPTIVWESLTNPNAPRTRPWLNLLDDEVPPRVLASSRPDRVEWSSLWPSRPRDRVLLELSADRGETLLRFTLLTPDELPDPSKMGHIRKRMNYVLFADLRFSYRQ